MANEAKVMLKLLGEGSLAPKSWINWWWNVGDTHMVWFYAVPKFSQAPYPRSIQIEKMWVTTPEPNKIIAWVKIINPDPPMQFDEGWPDVCYYKLYGAWASPI
jgi:hypothetical protein